MTNEIIQNKPNPASSGTMPGRVYLAHRPVLRIDPALYNYAVARKMQNKAKSPAFGWKHEVLNPKS